MQKMDKSEIVLFTAKDGQAITYERMLEALYSVGADQCDVLMLHTELSFGVPNPKLKRKQILGLLLDAFKELKVKTLLVPTFTYSFSNYKDYDVTASRTTMGALNEYMRKQPDAVRSIDPQMSFAVLGENKELVKNIGKDCIGKDSTFDKLHHTPDAKFLFFGTRIEQCFTHQHYVEKVLNVPYRYDMEFTGTIKDIDGKSYTDTYRLFVKYRDVIPYTPPEFVESLKEKGILKTKQVGDSGLLCMSEKDAFNETKRWIENDVNAFLGEPYDTKPLVKEYSYGNVTTVQ